MKVHVITDTRTEYNVTVEKNVYLAPHFKLVEMANNKGKSSLPQWVDSPESRTFMVILERFRMLYGKPIVVYSGYRQEDYNKKVGGDPKSAHKIGCAIDWHNNKFAAEKEIITSFWKSVLYEAGVVGAINWYTGGCHLEAFSDKCYGNTEFVIRDYRGTKKDW